MFMVGLRKKKGKFEKTKEDPRILTISSWTLAQGQTQIF